MRRVTDIKLVFALIAVIIGLTDFLARGSEAFHSIMMAFAVAAALTIGEVVFEIRNHQRRDKHSKQDILERFVKKHRNVIGELATNLNSDLERAVRFNDTLDEMEVDHPQLAIYSYDMFWTELVNRQSAGQQLTVLTVHACSFSVWNDDPLSAVLMERQKQFCASGGRVVRILCDDGPTLKPNTAAWRAAKSNLSVGVEVRYYNTRSKHVAVPDYDFSWDFAIVEATHEITHDSVIWESFKNAGSPIKKAVYLHNDRFKNWHLPTLWHQIESISAEVKPQDLGVNSGTSKPQLAKTMQGS